MKKKMLCRMHPDFHTPADAIVGKNFDAAEYIRKTKESGADSQVFFAKCHYGFAYYPTEVGTVHPGLQCDMLGEIAKECKKQDVALVVYESLFLDTAAAVKHPEWVPKSDPNPIKERDDVGKYAPICVNSGYVDELFIPQTLEIIRKYHPDELFFDTMCNFNPCYCDTCKEKFGADIPLDSSDPNWGHYVKWYNDCYDEFFAKITDAVYAESPETEITFNWNWSPRIPDSPFEKIRRVAGDLHPLASEASYNTRYWASTGREYEYMCGRFAHGLGDWTTNTMTTLKSVASAAVANGAGYYMIDRQLPDGTMEERTWDVAGELFGYLNKKRSFLEGATHAHEIAVLFSADHIVGPNLEFFPDRDKRDYQIDVHRSISEMLRVNGIHYTATNEDNLIKDIDTYKMVIIPETQFISDNLRDALLAFAEKGGKILMINCDNEQLLSAAGADIKENVQCEYVYVRDVNKNYPFIVRGGKQLVELNDNADVEACDKYPNMGFPMPIGDEFNHYGHGFAPYGGDTDDPAYVVNKKGNVGAILLPMLRSYNDWREPNIAAYVIGRIKDLLPDTMATLNTPALVEMALLKQNDDLIINLVNHSGREYLAAYWCPIVEYMPTITGATIELGAECISSALETSNEVGGQCGKIQVEDCDNGDVFELDVKNGCAKFEVPAFDIMHSFRVKKVF